MKRISILALCLIQSLFNCVDNDQRDKAHIKADELMKNLVEQNSEKYFPEKYFPREQLRPVLLDLKMNCDTATTLTKTESLWIPFMQASLEMIKSRLFMSIL